MKLPLRLLHTLLAAVCFAATPIHAADGPTPFPDAKDEAAWPGQGPIRVFGWMVDNRKAFWTHRDRDQGAVVFVGDSLIGGWKVERMVADFPGLKVANRGIGGDVSRGLLFRFREDVLDLKPRAIVMCIGSAILFGLTPALRATSPSLTRLLRGDSDRLDVIKEGVKTTLADVLPGGST